MRYGITTAIIIIVIGQGCAWNSKNQQTVKDQTSGSPLRIQQPEAQSQENGTPSPEETAGSGAPRQKKAVEAAGAGDTRQTGTEGTAGPVHPRRMSTDALTLEKALYIAETRNPALASMRYAIEVAEGRRIQAKLFPNPVFEFEAERMPDDDFGTFSRSENAFGVSQLIETAGKRKLRTKSAEKEKQMVSLDYELKRTEVLAETKRAFYDVLASQKELALARQTLAIAQGLYAASKERADVGDIAPIVAIRAKIEVARAQNQCSEAVEELAKAKKRLQTILGDDAGRDTSVPEPQLEIGEVKGELRSEVTDLSLDELVNCLLESHPSLQRAERNKELANILTEREKAEAVPDVKLLIGVERDAAENDTTFRVNVDVPVPIYNRNQGNIAAARAMERMASKDALTIRNALLHKLHSAYQDYSAGRDQVERFKTQIVPEAQESLQVVTTGYREGEFNYLDVLDAQRTLAQTMREYISVLRELNSAIADIERLTGRTISDR